MLNYNLNINSPLQQAKKNEDVRPFIYWDFSTITSASDSTDLNEPSTGTMNIKAPNSNCINITLDTGNLFQTDAQYSVTASVTGSNWPATGSTTMSLSTAGITYDPASTNQYYFSAVSASALDIYNNPNITGSKITNEFSASEFYRFYTSGSIVHMKGNVYNPLINWNQIAKSDSEDLLTDGTFINGNSASFNIVKNVNESLVAIPYASQSNSGAFYNQYALNVTSSLTASILANTTGSVTMSLIIPEIGFSTSSKFFNATSAGIYILSASFTASNNNPYNITASIINNKGNMSNANINWLAIQNETSQSNYLAVTFSIDKEGTANEVLVYPNLVSNGTIKNNYAFNQTASISAPFVPFFTGSTFVYVELGIKIPQNSVNLLSVASASLLTSSFAASTANPTYEITASATAYKTEQINLVLVGGGAGGSKGLSSGAGSGAGGSGGGGIFTGSFKIPSNQPYNIIIGKGGTGEWKQQVPPYDIDTNITASNGTATILSGYTDVFDTKQTLFISASGGLTGSSGIYVGPKTGGGIGGDSGNMNYTITTTIVSSSAKANGGTGSGGTGIAGGGGAGSYTNGSNAPTSSVGVTGNGGAGGTSIYPGFGGGGGGGARASFPTIRFGGVGNDGGGNGGNYNLTPSSGSNATPNTGGGGGGGSAFSGDVGDQPGGNGADGIAIISYAGTGSKATGGTITYNSGSNTTIHTFTSSGQFQILPTRY